MRPQLLAWQWSLYADAHRDRRNLLIHLFTAPLFPLGCLALLSSFWSWPLAIVGPVMILTALVAQGRGHKVEKTPPVPFLGPLDFVSRFFCEQWVTLPRFLLSGGWAKNWKAAGA